MAAFCLTYSSFDLLGAVIVPEFFASPYVFVNLISADELLLANSAIVKFLPSKATHIVSIQIFRLKKQ